MEGSPFLPLSDGLHIEQVTPSTHELLISVVSSSPTACCPLCGVQAWRIHSRYTRRVADVPCAGRHVTLLITVRKFFCPNAACSRTIFAEQFPELVPSYARLTTRLREALVALGFATSGGRPRIRAKIYQRSLVRLLKVIQGHAFRSAGPLAPARARLPARGGGSPHPPRPPGPPGRAATPFGPRSDPGCP